jgi:hypothetical protein
MTCSDEIPGVSDGVRYDAYTYVSKVDIDATSEEWFHQPTKNFAVPVLCTKVGTQKFSCIYNGKD